MKIKIVFVLIILILFGNAKYVANSANGKTFRSYTNINQPYTYNQIGNTYRTRDNNITEYNRYGQKVGIYRKNPSGTVSTRYYRYGNRPQGYHNFR